MNDRQTPSPHKKLTLWIAAAGASMLLIVGATPILIGKVLWPVLRPVLHKDVINKYSVQYNMDALWVMSIIKVESRFRKNARSRKGAIGLMQLMPGTAKEAAKELGISPDHNLEDPNINIRLGFHHLSRLKDEFGDDRVAILAAYNAGASRAREWNNKNSPLKPEDIPYLETRQFVEKVSETYKLLKFLQRIKNVFHKN